MKCIEDFLENKYKIDANYYIKNIAMNALDRVFSIGYNNILPFFANNVGFKPNSRKHFVHVSHPVKMLVLDVRRKNRFRNIKRLV